MAGYSEGGFCAANIGKSQTVSLKAWQNLGHGEDTIYTAGNVPDGWLAGREERQVGSSADLNTQLTFPRTQPRA